MGTRGCKIDSKNHNWALISHYLSLPFDYLSFRMREQIAQTEETRLVKQHSLNFNHRAFNYLFNRRTGILDGLMIYERQLQLRWVLENIRRLGEKHLEILFYTHFIQDDLEERRNE